METVCSECGEPNAPGTQFCSACGSYCGWQKAPAEDVAASTPERPVPPRSASEEPRDVFEAGIDVTDTTVPVDGEPATMTVNLSNTSKVVDSYVVEAVDSPSWLAVRPGRVELLPGTEGMAQAEMRIVSPTLVPAQRLPLLMRVHNTTGRSSYRDLLVRVTVPVQDAPVELRAVPQLLRARDVASAVCTVVVDNARSNRWARVRLSATDPERVVRATWTSQQLEVPPGEEARTEVRFQAPPPAPGGEVSRTITLTASDGRRSETTSLTFVQSTSAVTVEPLGLRLEPSVLRLDGRRQGHLAAMVDNRRGSTPVLAYLEGDDPENRMTFAFKPAKVEVPAGSVASVQVTVRTPRTKPGEEVTMPMRILVSDGRNDTSAEGRVIRKTPSLSGQIRTAFTVLGALAMLTGAFLQFFRSPTGLTSFDLTARDIAVEFNSTLNADGIEDTLSIGLVMTALGVLALIGRGGRSGKLTRRVAVLGALLVVAALVALDSLGSGVGLGASIMLVGCVSAYIGGLVGRR